LDLSVIILNWNTCALLEKCLRSLVCPQCGIEVEVIVVDNASGDGSREMVLREFPQVTLITNTKNVGFGAGNNVAVPQAHGRYVLFLNSDTVVMDGALAALVAYGDANPDIGILGPKLLNGDGSLQYSCRRYPNLATGFFRNTPLGRLFPKNRFATDYLLQDWDHATPRDVDWVSGAALMMRRELINQIGTFDEDYYMYCEDVDLCWRANHASRPADVTSVQNRIPQTDNNDASIQNPKSKTQNPEPVICWRVTYFPDSVIYHLIGKSSDQAPTRMTYEFHRSQYLFYRKHYAAATPLLLRPIIPVGIALRAVGTMARYRILYWQRRLTGREKRKRR
jgi:GT2 family glycosyltransferase